MALRTALTEGPKTTREATLLQRHILLRKCGLSSKQIDEDVSSLDALLVTYLEPDTVINDGKIMAYAINRALVGDGSGGKESGSKKA